MAAQDREGRGLHSLATSGGNNVQTAVVTTNRSGSCIVELILGSGSLSSSLIERRQR
jgi:hypothetical protein